jgi:predicted secreted hydrolase
VTRRVSRILRGVCENLCAAIACAIMTVASAADVSYPEVLPGYRIELPRDEGSHPQFRTEWWYLTGWLESEQGEPLGFQITFFRSRPGLDEDNPSRFSASQLLFAHAAISDPKRGVLVHDERSARAGFGLAAAAEEALDVHIDDWFMRKDGERYRAGVGGKQFSIEIDWTATQPPLLQGKDGFSQKGPETHLASYYYSLPQLEVNGCVILDGRERRVHGVAWFDHEWSSSIMDEAARGWDWVGLNLDDGGALMAFRMRDERGNEHWAAASWRDGAQAVTTTYSPAQIEWTALHYWRSARTGIRYPVEWKVTIGGRTIKLRASMDDQENDARGSTGTIYWEGGVRAFDEADRPLGRGYLELTGYGSRVSF